MTQGPPHHYPPPGAPPPDDPPVPAPGWPPPGSSGPSETATPSYGAYPVYGTAAPTTPPPGMLGAAHKPGAIPLRPLTLGSMYDGAFRIIRFNPKATVGAAVLVTAAAMLIPVIISVITAFTVGTGIDASGEVDDDLGTGEALGLIGSFGSLLIGLYAAQLGIIFVTGMIAHVTHAAAVGRRLSLAEAWAATHGKRWRLIGLTVLVGVLSLVVMVVAVGIVVGVALVTDSVLATVLLGLLVGAALICGMVWAWIRVVYLATPALMLEPVGVFGSLGRNWRLTRRQFWRTFGIGLLTVIVTGFAGGILATPVSFIGQFGALAVPEYTVVLLVVTQALSLVIQNAFVAPFTSAVTTLQYVDQRMRKEAYDVELMREAGLIPR